MTIMQLLANKRCLEIIVENMSDSSKIDMHWPRSYILEAWKSNLQLGDYVDAMHEEKGWAPAVMTLINEENGDIKVHFLGTNSSEDIEINDKSKMLRLLKPLFSKSLDRRKWNIGKQVEIKVDNNGHKSITEGKNSDTENWVIGEISDVDLTDKKVKVKSRIQVSSRRKIDRNAYKKLILSNIMENFY